MQHRHVRRTARFAAVAGAFLIGSLIGAAGQGNGSGQWTVGGGDLFNRRYAAGENKISATNAARLKVKWVLPMHGDVSATPTVESAGDVTNVYAVDWGGYLYSIDGATGHIRWSHPLSYYTGNPVSVSRTSPAIVGNTIVIGDQGCVNSAGFPDYSTTASVMAINKNTGELVWRAMVSSHPYSVITSAPVAYNGVVYAGVSSLEENAGFIPGYPGFSYQGNVVALNAKTGALLWQFTTVPAGYTGGSVWGGSPVIDAKRGSLYVGTGNNYSVPAGVGPNPGELPVAGNDYFDSILALDLNLGTLKWATRVRDHDTWDVYSWILKTYYGVSEPDLGPDYDFGSAPNLITTKMNGQMTDLLGAGQKSGIYWALNPDSGAVVWSAQVGPGGTGGGIEWGSATDSNRVYCAISNTDSQPTPLGTNAGLWAGLDAATGNVLWRTADPIPGGGHDVGMVTIANGVVFAGSAGIPPGAAYPAGVPGGMFAMNAATGQILWSFPTDGAVICGPSVVSGTVFWGSGYSHLANAFGISGNPKLYAFSVQ